MIDATNLKSGITFLLDGKPYQVIKYTHQKIARGGGTVKLSVRNLSTGASEEKTLSSSTKVEEISTLKKGLQFLYKDADKAVFMDPKTYEQVEIPVSLIEKEIPYMKEGGNVSVLFWNEEALSVEISPKITLEVTDTVPGVKGNSATNIYKPATLENGLKIKVPLFIKKGDKIRVDTRTGGYMERAT